MKFLQNFNNVYKERNLTKATGAEKEPILCPENTWFLCTYMTLSVFAKEGLVLMDGSSSLNHVDKLILRL